MEMTKEQKERMEVLMRQYEHGRKEIENLQADMESDIEKLIPQEVRDAVKRTERAYDERIQVIQKSTQVLEKTLRATVLAYQQPLVGDYWRVSFVKASPDVDKKAILKLAKTNAEVAACVTNGKESTRITAVKKKK